MIVTLIGYRGSGKSSVAPLLAKHLQCNWVDSDDEVEQRAGRSIRQIFDDDGEQEFRHLESQVLEQLFLHAPLVIAAGGGAVLSAENRQRMRSAGPVVWLQATPRTLAARIADDAATAQQRPSLTGRSVTEEVAEVLEKRLPAYQEAATIVVEVDRLSPAEVVEAIIPQLPAEGTH